MALKHMALKHMALKKFGSKTGIGGKKVTHPVHRIPHSVPVLVRHCPAGCRVYCRRGRTS